MANALSHNEVFELYFFVSNYQKFIYVLTIFFASLPLSKSIAMILCLVLMIWYIFLDTLHPNGAVGSTQWTNTIQPRILKYSIKIIKNATLQNLLAYTEPYASSYAVLPSEYIVVLYKFYSYGIWLDLTSNMKKWYR